ncbi:rod shape-determining protein RodA [Rubricoccus marinus]|uniref:Cell wall polymerase n=1 Tax=Rubricoccus marinus TaxID=716817 RepID=A0A259TWU9_9BACT|nr:rod shape-determining protein RodA [Rubricoccus marinus]OZC02166.1 rod shape-determining protein RodA [Rubricoccus marinus]
MRPWYKRLDWPTILAWAALVGVGLTAIYSSTHGPAREFLLDSVKDNANKQAMWAGISFGVMVTIFLMPARFLIRMAPVAYVFCLGLLVAALVFGREINGAKSWLQFGGASLQVAELAKVGTVLAVAAFLSRTNVRSVQAGLNSGYIAAIGGLAVIILVPTALVILQNDTGTGLVFLAMGFFVVFWSGLVSLPLVGLAAASGVAVYLAIVNPWYLAIFALLASAGYMLWTRSKLLTGLAFAATAGIGSIANFVLYSYLQPHQVSRLVAFTDPQKYASTAGYHVIQSKAAIGSGGLFGKGITQGTQTQLAYIPEQSTDFVFTIIGEELGFVGTAFILIVFSFLILRLVSLGQEAASAAPRLFIAGVTGIFLTHILINVGMTIGLMPVIGIPLPFVSYGGSALLANTTMLAIALTLHARHDEFAVYRTG